MILSGGEWSVWGSTSRGCFIGSLKGQVFFLTHSSYRGPLTVNLNGSTYAYKTIPAGAPVMLGRGRIVITSVSIDLPIGDPEIWASPLPNGEIANPAQSIARARHLVEEVIRRIPENGEERLVAQLDLHDSIPVPDRGSPSGPGHRPALSTIHRIIAGCHLDELVFELDRLVGYGHGLTPSGDDFILGVLLGLNRWQFPGWGTAKLKSLNDRVISIACQKTTAISACLIECAAAGQADERMITTLDYLFSGHGDEQTAIAGILDWGSSSGTDALTGMVTCIQALTS